MSNNKSVFITFVMADRTSSMHNFVRFCRQAVYIPQDFEDNSRIISYQVCFYQLF